MNLPTPLYQIGQTVFFYQVVQSDKQTRVCPDCVGEKVWKVTMPNCRQYEVKCLRCRGSGTMDYYLPAVEIEEGVITNTRVDLARKEPVEYALRYRHGQTIQKEGKVASTADEARLAAQELFEAKMALALNDPAYQHWKDLTVQCIIDLRAEKAEKRAKELEKEREQLVRRVLDMPDWIVPTTDRFDSQDRPAILKSAQVETIQDYLLEINDYGSELLDEHRSEGDD